MPFSKLAASVISLLAPLSLSPLDGSGAALLAAVFSSVKEAFIAASVHLRTKEALHRHDLRPFAFNAYILEVNAQKRIDGEDLDVKISDVTADQSQDLARDSFSDIKFHLGKVRFQTNECYSDCKKGDDPSGVWKHFSSERKG